MHNFTNKIGSTNMLVTICIASIFMSQHANAFNMNKIVDVSDKLLFF